MFKKALVGLDLSPAEKPMMDCLSDLKRWGIEEIVLTHIVHVGYVDSAGYGHKDEYAAWLNERAEALSKVGFQASIEVRYSGVVADELLQAASDESADVLIIGSRSHNLVYDIFLGSVAQAVLRKADLPVLLERIEPTEEGTEMICQAMCRQNLATLMLATDFSKHAHSAETIAVELSRLADRSYFLSVVEPDDQNDADTAIARLNEIKEQAGSFAERIDVCARTGEPAREIIQCAEEVDATLIVLGKHGRGWLPNKLIGSTPEQITSLCKRPVLMVPH